MTTPDLPEHLVERAAKRMQEFGLGALDAPAPPPSGGGAAGPAAADVPPAPGAAAAAASAQPPPLKVTMEQLQAAGLVIGGDRRSRVSEEYQVLSMQMLRSRTAAQGALPGNLVMVTSTRPGEGKSFTALNLAASLAQDSRTKTLLIDTDPKQASLTARLGLSERPGLFDLSTNSSLRVDAMIVETAIANLRLLPIGTIASNHSATRQIAGSLDRLARRFADCLLIMDAPPCLSTSDPSMLAALVSQIIMVVEAGQTQRRQLEHALNIVDSCPNIVLALNKIQFGGANAFGAYGYYGA